MGPRHLSGRVSGRVPYAPLWCGLAVLLIYWPALSGDFVYDDEMLVQKNAALRDGDVQRLLSEPFYAGQIGYWRPVASLLMSAAWQVGGIVGLHTLALTVHALAGVAMLRLAERALGNSKPAAIAALLFLWHPVQVESAAWCSAVSGPIAGLMTLLAIEFAMRWRDRTNVLDMSHANSFAWLAAGAWATALLAKESAVTGLPLVLAAIAWLPGRPTTMRWRQIVSPFALVLIAWGGIRLLLLAQPFGTTAPGSADPLSTARCVTASLELLVRHLGLLVAPGPLTPFHPFDESIGLVTALSYTVIVMIIGVGVGLAARRASGSTRFALALIAFSLLPHLLTFRVVGLYPLAERYLYIAAAGYGLLALTWTARHPRWRFVPIATAGIFAFLAFSQTAAWQDQRALLTHGLCHAPDDPLLHVMLGNLELRTAEAGSELALTAARRAYSNALNVICVDPTNREPAGAAATKARNDARVGLAWCELFAQQHTLHRDPSRIVSAFDNALAGEETAAAWVGLGIGYELQGDARRARDAWRQALALDDRCAEAWYFLARLDYLRGQRAQARINLQRALRSDPDFVPAKSLLAALR